MIVKYSILAGFFLFTTALLVGSYMHARMRMKKNLDPLSYHRWMVAGRVYTGERPYYGGNAPYPQGTYGMHNMPPPPVYDPNRPPIYENSAPPPGPPPAGTKVDPSQWRGEPTRRPAGGADGPPEYQPPPGPPPAMTRPPMP
jgi:hypothetical protein